MAEYYIKRSGVTENHLKGKTQCSESSSAPSEFEYVIVQAYTTALPSIGEPVNVYLLDNSLYMAGTIDSFSTQQTDETSSKLEITIHVKGFDVRLYSRLSWDHAHAKCIQFRSYAGWVNTSGINVYWVDGTTVGQSTVGDKFSPDMFTLHKHLIIDGIQYTVASVISPVHLTLTTSAGTQTGADYQFKVFCGTAVKYLLDVGCDSDGFTYNTSGTTISDGLLINELVFDPPVSVYDAIQQLVKFNDGYAFSVDANQECHFGPWTVRTAPTDFTDSSSAYKKTINIERDRSDVRNVEVSQYDLRGAGTVTDSFIGDGVTQDWFLTKQIMQLVSVKLNGVASTSVSEYDPAGTNDSDYLYRGRDNAFWQNALNPVLISTDTLTVEYYQVAANLIEFEDDPAIAARQSVEGGGSGRYVQYIDRTQFRNWLDAQQDAEASVNRFKADLVNGTLITRDNGYRVGQIVTFNVANNKLNAQMFIDKVDASDSEWHGVGNFLYTLTIISASRRITAESALRAIFMNGSGGSSGGSVSVSGGGGGGGSSNLLMTRTLTASTTNITSPSTPVDGQLLTVILTQDVTGGRQITWSSDFTYAPVDIDTTSNAVTILQFVGSSSKWILTQSVGR